MTSMKRLLQFFFPLVALCLLGYNLSVPITNAGGWQAFWTVEPLANFTNRLFHLAGIAAFTLLGFQVLTGPYMKLWERLYGPKFYKFHAYEGVLAFCLTTLHPLLVYIYLYLIQLSPIEFAKNYPSQYYFGPLAWLFMLLTVSTAVWVILLQRQFKYWHWLHLLNYAVFLFAFYHSLTIGADVAPPDSPLRPIWWFFFIGMVVGLVYRRIYRPVKEKDLGLDT